MILTFSNKLVKTEYLNKQIHFTRSVSRKVLVGSILCVYLCFIIIFLQPFDTRQFEAEYKKLLLSGYGIFTFFVFVAHGCIENAWYYRFKKVWLVRHEILSTFIFCLFSGTVLYLYNRLGVNLTGLTLQTYWRFLSITVAYMLPVFIPLMLYLRQKFGEKIVPLPENSFVLTGENRNELLKLEKNNLLFIKAVENYVEICFTDDGKKVISKTFRQTLSNVSEQLPFLEKCHRSYLININNVKEIEGNSQGAAILFAVGDKEVPLSKTFYKHIKGKMV